jgi:hypothetical protein
VEGPPTVAAGPSTTTSAVVARPVQTGAGTTRVCAGAAIMMGLGGLTGEGECASEAGSAGAMAWAVGDVVGDVETLAIGCVGVDLAPSLSSLSSSSCTMCFDFCLFLRDSGPSFV